MCVHERVIQWYVGESSSIPSMHSFSWQDHSFSTQLKLQVCFPLSVAVLAQASVGGPSQLDALPDMAEVSVSMALTVDGGRLGGRPWIVHGVEQLEGRDFAPLDKRDTGLSRFVLGVSQGNPLKDYLFFDDLRQQRNHLTLELNRPTKQGSQAWRKAKVAVQVGVQESEVVELPRPAIEVNGETMEATIVRVKRPQSFNERVLVEFDANTLRYVRLAILAGGKRADARTRPMRIDTGAGPRVRWIKSREAYLAKRDGGSHMHFKVASDGADDIERRHAVKKARAMKWADGISDLSGSDGPAQSDHEVHEDVEQDDVEEPGA